jgi:hypothetical protein
MRSLPHQYNDDNQDADTVWLTATLHTQLQQSFNSQFSDNQDIKENETYVSISYQWNHGLDGHRKIYRLGT